MSSTGPPQRVRCRHCGKLQVEYIDDKGRIHVQCVGGQLSKGPGGAHHHEDGKVKKGGVSVLRENAEQHKRDREKYPPNIPVDKQRKDDPCDC